MAVRLTVDSLRVCAVLVVALLCCVCAGTADPGRQGPGAGGVCAQPTFGIETVDASRALRRQYGIPDDVHGAMVVEMLPDSPAARAGLAIGDVVERLETAGSHEVNGFAGLNDAMGAARCGESVRLTIRRGGARLTWDVIPVDGIAFFANACRRGLATGCFRQGVLTAAGAGGSGLFDDSTEELYDRACKLGSGGGCRELAQLSKDPARAADRRRLLERSCALHHASGCVDLGSLYALGRDGVARDDARAAPLYIKACDGGEPAGCFNAGVMAEHGRGVATDLAAAVAAYEEGCRGGSSEACTSLGALYYDEGHSVAASPERAATYYDRGCSGSSWSASVADACVNLGVLYRDGKGVRQDAHRAVELFTAACGRAPSSPEDTHTAPVAAHACSLLGAQLAHGSGVVADWQRAIELSKKGCDGGDAFGCVNLASAYLNGEGVAQNDDRALSYFRRACEVGHAESCFEAGLLVAQGHGARLGDPRAAAAWYQRACDGGSGEGCASLGVLYDDGPGVQPDPQRAIALFARGCELGEPTACFDLANHYADGTGVEQDQARAAKLYAKACGGGCEPACAKAAAEPPH
jgi:hypothetical protein